jgi:hypothetical protein
MRKSVLVLFLLLFCLAFFVPVGAAVGASGASYVMGSAGYVIPDMMADQGRPAGQYSLVQCYVHDAKGNAIPGVAVYFTIDTSANPNQNKIFQSSVTDSTGRAYAHLSSPIAGSASVSAYYQLPGDNKYTVKNIAVTFFPAPKPSVTDDILNTIQTFMAQMTHSSGQGARIPPINGAAPGIPRTSGSGIPNPQAGEAAPGIPRIAGSGTSNPQASGAASAIPSSYYDDFAGLFTGTYTVSVNTNSTNAYRPEAPAKNSQFSANFGVTDQGSDIVIDGYYKSVPIHLVSKVTRTLNSAKCVVSFNLANKTISGEAVLTFTMSGGTATLSGMGEGAYVRPYTPANGADYHPGSGKVTGARISTALPNNMGNNQDGVGPVGDIPGPDNTDQAATGIIAPGLLTLAAAAAGSLPNLPDSSGGPDASLPDGDGGDGSGDGGGGDGGDGGGGDGGDGGGDSGGGDTGTAVGAAAGVAGEGGEGGPTDGAVAAAAGAIAGEGGPEIEEPKEPEEPEEPKEPKEPKEDDSGEKTYDQLADNLKEEKNADLKDLYKEKAGEGKAGVSEEGKTGDEPGVKEEETLSSGQIEEMVSNAKGGVSEAENALNEATNKFNAAVVEGKTGAKLVELGDDVKSAQIAKQEASNALNELESNIKNTANLNTVIDKVGDALALKGAYDDYVKNLAAGDDASISITKSLLSNGITGQLSKENPAVAVMDTINSVAFGGTEAGKIMGPGENIKNASNFFVDKIMDMANGTDNASKHIDAGDYGQTIQNFSDASKLGSELLTDDTGKTAQEFTDILTGDDWYKNMHEGVPDLFKTGEDASGLKKIASLIGAKSLDNVVSSLETVKDASAQLGAYFGSHSNQEMLTDGLNAAKDTGSTLIDAASHPVETLGVVAGMASDAVKGAIDSDFANKLGGAVKQTFKEGVGAAKEDGSTLIDAASHPVETIGVVAGMTADTVKGAYNAASGVVSGIAKSDTGATVIDAASHPVETIGVVAGMASDAAKGAFNAVSSTASSAASVIKGWFS